MKIYELEFHLLAQKEWQKLDSSVREQFKKQISKRLLQPHIPSARLSAELSNFYKIKLKALGYRLAYEVIDHRLVIHPQALITATLLNLNDSAQMSQAISDLRASSRIYVPILLTVKFFRQFDD